MGRDSHAGEERQLHRNRQGRPHKEGRVTGGGVQSSEKSVCIPLFMGVAEGGGALGAPAAPPEIMGPKKVHKGGPL